MNGDRLAAVRAKARPANVNESTLLATDFLNHFNEPMMLLELVPDMPECVADLEGWTPISYEEHFSRSNFSGREVAIEAYGLSPPEFRVPFDTMIERLGKLLQATISGAGRMIERGNPAAAAEIVRLAMPAIRRCQETAGAIINGAVVSLGDEGPVEAEGGAQGTLQQADIDSLLGA